MLPIFLYPSNLILFLCLLIHKTTVYKKTENINWSKLDGQKTYFYLKCHLNIGREKMHLEKTLRNSFLDLKKHSKVASKKYLHILDAQ